MKIELISDLLGPEGAIYTLEQAAIPQRFFSGSSDNLVVEWDMELSEPIRAVASLPSRSYALKYIAELNLLVVGNYSGGMHVIDLNIGKEIRLFQLHSKTIFNLEYDEKRQRIISLSADGSYAVWSVPDFKLLHHEVLTKLNVRCLAFRPDQDEMAIGCGDGSIRIIHTETFAQLARLEGHLEGFSVTCLAYTPNQKQLISGSRDARLNFWDLKSGYELVNKIPAHNFAIYSIVFHPSKPFYATGSRDKTIRIWKLGKMRPLKTIDVSIGGHKNSVNKLLWSDFNDYLISTGDDRSIKVWDVIV